MCETYWAKISTVSAPPLFGGNNVQSQILNDLQSSFHRYVRWGLTVFVVKKYWKINYGFEDSISNVDLSSATKQPINV